ncbi:MAG: DNA mismatch repair protein MutS [Desulfovibrio sp.]|jgi:DNA mismatch repair protein MutS|nr:DNA mismatch repair protein MutS [Desulfovibrio sp.]
MTVALSNPPLHPAPDIPVERLTPMFIQYLDIKRQCENALLFYRMGDFYEMFFDDALVAAKALQITLTSRNPGAEYPTPMCGVPHHSYLSYARQLIDLGFNVAICEQTEDPKNAKGLVKREILRILTPGTIIDDGSLEAKAHNYLGAFYWNTAQTKGGFAWLDYSTGEWSGLYSKRKAELAQWVQKMQPRELLLPDLSDADLGLALKDFPPEVTPVRVPIRAYFDLKSARTRIFEAQNVQDLGVIGLEGKEELTRACGALLAYIMRTQKQGLEHLKAFKPLNLGQHLIIDEITERNLEIFRTIDGKKGQGALLHVLDETITPMGGRLLEERLRHPWLDANCIASSADIVQFFFKYNYKRAAVRETLDSVYDLERLTTRITLGRATPKDLAALGKSLSGLALLRNALDTPAPGEDASLPDADNIPEKLKELCLRWDNLSDLSVVLQNSLCDLPPLTLTEGGIFRVGFNPELDELLDIINNGEKRLETLLLNEQTTNKLPRLKLGFNRVFGYYFELNKSFVQNLPAHFIRRQTVANAERYVTPELKELEDKITGAGDQAKKLEYKLFRDLCSLVTDSRPRILFMAENVAALDFWQGLAEAARKRDWRRPLLHAGTDIIIRQGRHPVVEAACGAAGFVPNDLHMDKERRMLIITGPNMSGKSTVLRQAAIIMLLAQIGSYVPAQQAHLGITDRIFSRVGASDNLSRGQSTFMVEMMETARILRQATPRSLVILDEIGRGTSTFDGLSLAWAVAEDLAGRKDGPVRTLFATHYHELTSLEKRLPGVHNMNIAVQEYGGEIIFMRRLVPGPSDRSYGIEVAKLAGVPASVVQRAKVILQSLEKSKSYSRETTRETMRQLLPGLPNPEEQNVETESRPLPEKEIRHPLFTILTDLDTDSLTPMQALLLVNEWKKLWGKGDDADN